MTAPTFFTVVADFKSVVADVFGDSNYSPELGVVTGNVSFTPLITPNSVVRAPNAEPRPLGLLPARIEGFIDVDGRLKLYADPEQPLVKGGRSPSVPKSVAGNTPYDYSPIQLLADTDYIELGGQPLYYRVTFSDVTYNGQDRRINSFTFQAPPAPVELNLISLLGTGNMGKAVTPPPGAISILPSQVRVENKKLYFTVQGVDIPDPIDVRGFGELTAAELETVRQELLGRIQILDGRIVATNPQTGDVLTWNGTEWVNISAYTKVEIDGKLSGLASGLARKPAVQDIADTPPATPATGETYIVGTAPTDAWAGHPNEVVFWDGAAWVFGNPVQGDTHTNLKTNVSWSWNGTDWVALGSQASNLTDLGDVTISAVPTTGYVLSWDGSKWVDAEIPKHPLDDCTDVNTFGVLKDQVLQYDGTEWKPGTLPGSTLDALTDVDVPAPVAGNILSYQPGGKWEAITPSLVTTTVDGLVDVTAPTPGDGDALVWDDTAKQWVNGSQNKSLDDLTDVDTGAAIPGDTLVFDGADWLPTGQRLDDSLNDVLVDDPQNEDMLVFDGAQWVNQQLQLGNLSDLALGTGTDGEVLTFDGGVWVNQAPAAVPTTLDALTDVATSTPVDGQVLTFDTASSQWANKTLPGYTKTEVDTKLETLATGLAHGESVNSITATPPSAPVEGDLVIVATGATGAFAGHVNSLALWDSGNWVFTPPEANETHLVEDQDALFHWNGTAWVKVASTTAATGATAKQGVGEIIPWMADTVPDGYLECKGQVVAIASYADLYAVLGNKYNAGTGADGTTTFSLPDLRGYFLRGTGANGGEVNVGVVQNDTTRLSRTAMTGVTNTTGSHDHGLSQLTTYGATNGPIEMIYKNTNVPNFTKRTDPGGDHSHTVTINGGGDVETRPKSVSVKWIIRVFAINGGAQGPKGEKGDSAYSVTLMAMIGDIKQSVLTETQFKNALPAAEQSKWVLADGRNVAGTAYASATGRNTVPDLRGAYLRMAGQNSTNAAWNGGTLNGWQDHSTARPNTAFTTDSQGSHSHWNGKKEHFNDINVFAYGKKSLNSSGWVGGNTDGFAQGLSATSTDGAHTHTIVQGGDTETRPKTYSVNYYIKIDN